MEKKKKINKYDIIIYSSLLIAIIFIVISIKSYYESLDDNETFFSSFKEAVREINETDGTPIIEREQEPDELKPVDKKDIINKELTKIQEDKSLNTFITKDMLKTWEKYEITNIEYIRKIVDNYYCYQVEIKIPNINAITPVEKIAEKSTEEYITISLYFNIAYKNKTYTVKSIEVPNR